MAARDGTRIGAVSNSGAAGMCGSAPTRGAGIDQRRQRAANWPRRLSWRMNGTTLARGWPCAGKAAKTPAFRR